MSSWWNLASQCKQFFEHENLGLPIFMLNEVEKSLFNVDKTIPLSGILKPGWWLGRDHMATTVAWQSFSISILWITVLQASFSFIFKDSHVMPLQSLWEILYGLWWRMKICMIATSVNKTICWKKLPLFVEPYSITLPTPTQLNTKVLENLNK